MTVNTTTNRYAYVGNGATLAFAFSSVFLAAADLKVYLNGVLKTLNTHYTVTGGSGATGTVTFLSAPATDDSVVILNDPAITQTTDLINGDPLPAQSLEQMSDRLTLIAQRLANRMDYAVSAPDFDVTGVPLTLPAAALRANKFLTFDADGDIIMSSGVGTDDALRADLATGSASLGAELVAFLQAGAGAVARTVQARFRDTLNVKDFGAVGDGVTDDTAAINAAKAQMVRGSSLFFPRGAYKVTSTIDFSALFGFTLIGESSERSNNGTTIFGAIAGDDVVKCETGSTEFFIGMRGIHFNNTSATGRAALTLSGVMSSKIEDCCFSSAGAYGLYMPQNTFCVHVDNCKFAGFGYTGIGAYASGHTTFTSCDITGWEEGIRASGTTCNVIGGRIEVNKTGLMLGKNAAGVLETLQRSVIHGISFEANDTHVKGVYLRACAFSGNEAFGSVNSPAGQTEYGFDIDGAEDTTFLSCNQIGTYSKAAVRISGGGHQVWTSCRAENGLANKPKWDVRIGLTNIIFDNCDVKLRPGDDASRHNYRRHGNFQYLAQIDYLNDAVEGKNLRGKNVALGNGVNTKAIAFTGAGHSPGNATINTAAASATGGTLAAGTYYYTATAITAHGECSLTAEKTVVVGGPNDSATLTWFGMTADGFKRRIYRGTAPGVYDGYFEMALDSNANFVDNGAVFDGYKTPPLAGIDDTNMTEPDANYGVVVTPSWLTTVRVTGKLTTGFTVDFGTATPDANQTIDYVIVR